MRFGGKNPTKADNFRPMLWENVKKIKKGIIAVLVYSLFRIGLEIFLSYIDAHNEQIYSILSYGGVAMTFILSLVSVGLSLWCQDTEREYSRELRLNQYSYPVENSEIEVPTVQSET